MPLDEVPGAKKTLRQFADQIRKDLPEGYGVTLFVFEQGVPNGMLHYISTAARPDMIRVVEEWLREQRRRQARTS